MYYDPQSAGIILQSPQSDSTPWTLTLAVTTFFRDKIALNWVVAQITLYVSKNRNP